MCDRKEPCSRKGCCMYTCMYRCSSVSLKQGATMISWLGINLIDALIHIQVFCWLNFWVHGPWLKSLHTSFLYLFFSETWLSLYLWWTKKWILWLYFWVLSVPFKILQLRVKTCIEDISTFIISYVFFLLIIILTNAPIEPITKNNRRKKTGSKNKKSII